MDAMVEVATGTGSLLTGRTLNISRGGLCVELDSALEAGSVVEIRVALLFHDRRQSEPLALPARIVWCTRLADGCQVGSQFLRLSSDQAMYLDLFLSYIDAAARPELEAANDDPFAF
jgi:hypothetical protein